MDIERTENSGACTLRLGGELRLPDARVLFERVLGESCSSLVLDFTAAEVEDRALDALAHMLNDAHIDIAVRGLRARQLRLLEYLGAAHPAR